MFPLAAELVPELGELAAGAYQAGTLKSTSLSAYAYSAATATLALTFRESGKTYEYAPVSQYLFDQFMHAGSKGAFYSDRIKPLGCVEV
jgi:hypothetical protein